MPALSAQAPTAVTCPEAELLLCCARTYMDAANATRIRALLQEDVDWTHLLRTALRHGVIPLLYQSLHTVCPEAVPKVALDQLQGLFYSTAGRTLFLIKELLKLLRLLEGHGIPAIPYKGPALAAAVYGNALLRQFDDLDILVHKRDILMVEELLISQGYRLGHSLIDAQGADHPPSKHAYTFVRHDGRVVVDLHWSVSKKAFSFPLDPEYLWKRLEPVSLAGTTIHSLPPEDLLLILCVHGATHAWERLAWVCDIAELIRVNQETDWPWVMEQARTLGSERMLWLGLLLARDLLGTSLPEEVERRLPSPSVVPSLVAQVRTQLFREADDASTAFEKYYFTLRMVERLQDRVQCTLHFVHQIVTPNTKDRVFVPLPVWLSFLYYLLRPMRLVRAYGLSLSQRLLRTGQIALPGPHRRVPIDSNGPRARQGADISSI